MTPQRLIFADYHNHALPGMHDGPRTPEDAERLLLQLRNTGICRIMLTPTYRPFFESVRRFRMRRASAWHAMARKIPRNMQMGLGALVALEEGCCGCTDIAELALPGTKHLIVELPTAPFPEWFDYEMHLLLHRRKLWPIFAGFERYSILYTPEQLDHVMRVPNAAYQFTLRALVHEDIRNLARQLYRRGQIVLLGTGAFSPDYDYAYADSILQSLRSCLGNASYTSLILDEFNFAQFRL